MNTQKLGSDQFDRMGDSATGSMEPPWSALAALPLLVGRGPLRCHALTARAPDSPLEPVQPLFLD